MFSRTFAVSLEKHRLQADSFPRLQMSLLVGLTGASGLLFSFLMLHAGLGSMALRYPLALAAAYLVFLGLLWLWLRTQATDGADIPDPSFPAPDASCGDAAMPIQSGGGGDFGGGGASGSFGDPASPAEAALQAALQAPDATSSAADASDGIGIDIDAGDLGIPIAVLALVLGMALASLYVVYAAPALFAELLVDGALSYSLYRHLRRAEPRHWFTTALRHTLLPFALTAIFLALAGAEMSHYAPDARSIGDVMRTARA